MHPGGLLIHEIEVADFALSFSETTSPIFPRVKHSENKDIDVGDLVANLIVSHGDLAHLAGIELGQPHTKTRVNRNSLCAGDQLTHDAKCCLRIDGIQELMKPNKVAMGLARPPESHNQRRARRFGLERPSAHASTSAW